MNLRQKLASVRREIKNIEKKGYNEAQNYAFMRHEDIAGEVGDMLAELNIVVGRENLKYQFDVIEVQRKNGMVKDSHIIITLTYVFYDGDSDETLRVDAIGEGRDNTDKAVPKALSGALKYALSQPLVMRVGEDAEEAAEHDRDTPSKPADDPFADTPPTPKADPKLKLQPDNEAKLATQPERAVFWKMVQRVKGDGARTWLENRCIELNGSPDGKKLTVAHIKELTSMLQQPEDESQEPPQIDDDLAAGFDAEQEKAHGAA